MGERTGSELERALERVTEFGGAETQLWKAALEEARTRGDAGPSRRREHIGTRVLVVAGVVIVGLVIVGAMLPAAGRARNASPRALSMESPSDSARLNSGTRVDEVVATLSERFNPDVTADLWREPEQSAAEGVDVSGFARQVIRTARIELRVADVDVGYRAVRGLVRPELGEFVQEASLRGEGGDRRGALTVRVAADRVEDVVTALGELGIVVDQRLEGRDVTERVVDLDARLRNERRVEAELLELLASREDAPLEDVMKVRTALGAVRGEIERLGGELASVRRLVALATVQVELATDAAGAVRSDAALDRVGAAMGRALRSGGRTLLSSVAGAVELLVGGLFWWVILGVIGVVGYRAWRRSRAWA